MYIHVHKCNVKEIITLKMLLSNLKMLLSNYDFLVPAAPTDLMISPPSGSCDQLMVTWTAPSNTGGLPVKYKVYRNGDEVHSMRTTTIYYYLERSNS